MTDDQKLLRNYAETGSESAFNELVSRHVTVVYPVRAPSLSRSFGPTTPLSASTLQIPASVHAVPDSQSNTEVHEASAPA